MTRKKVILSAVCSLLVIFAGAGWMIKNHFATAAQKLLSEMTDMGVVMEEVEFHYSPLPSLTVKNLQITDGDRQIKIPLFEVYPDVAELLKGNVRLKQVVAQSPVITSPAIAASDSSDSSDPVVLPAVFPDNLEIVSGRVTLTGAGGDTPLTVSADVEKGGAGMAFNVRSASIKELGFNFSGKIDIRSMSPLKVGLEAKSCSIDPAEFLGFLTDFGYLDNSTIPELASVEKFETGNLNFDVDTVTGTMNFNAESLTLDGSAGQNLKLDLGRDGKFELGVAEASISAGELYAMAVKSERGRTALAGICKSAHLKSMIPDGSLVLKNVVLSSDGNSTGSAGKGLNGRFTLSAKGLNLTLTSLEGKTQKLSIGDLDADVEIRDGKPVVSVRKFNLASSEGGSVVASASFSFPFNYKELKFNSQADGFKLFDNELTLSAEKKTPLLTGFDLEYKNRDMSVAAAGRLKNSYYGSGGIEAVLSSMRVSRSEKKEEKDAGISEQPFDFSPLLAQGLNGKAVIRKFSYNDWPFSDVNISLQSGKDRAVVNAKGRLFHLSLDADAVFSSDKVAAQCNVKGRGASLPSLIACFADDLSVYLRGSVFLNANVFVQGENPKELVGSARGEGLLKISNLDVYRLSNLDDRLGFLVDMLRVVSMSPGDKDSLSFSSAVVRTALVGQKVFMNSFTLRGPLIQAWGDGSLDMQEKRLILDGKVRSAVGTVNTLNIDRKFRS
ncbi:hypothetical protein [Maridesulfovibrio bastinii]|uniref:hypothetical protein n=1 Tax=Maridesulfovibrio bastinii TaxID=47157 RepID=UPI00042144A2|nr:hypothetical protein [Maridesulfovibrio bastinii]